MERCSHHHRDSAAPGHETTYLMETKRQYPRGITNSLTVEPLAANLGRAGFKYCTLVLLFQAPEMYCILVKSWRAVTKFVT